MKPWTLALAACALVAAPTVAAAGDDTIRSPGEHPKYTVELEPHALIGYDAFGWGGFGFGLGGRASVPLMDNGFVPKINNQPAITFGIDWMHFESSCYYYFAGIGGCSANYVYFPLGLQWNFYVSKAWSVFAEAGFAPFYGSYSDFCDTLDPRSVDYLRCNAVRPSHFNFEPWGSLGGRYSFNEKTSLVMRLGVPTFMIGVSFK